MPLKPNYQQQESIPKYYTNNFDNTYYDAPNPNEERSEQEQIPNELTQLPVKSILRQIQQRTSPPKYYTNNIGNTYYNEPTEDTQQKPKQKLAPQELKKYSLYVTPSGRYYLSAPDPVEIQEPKQISVVPRSIAIPKREISVSSLKSKSQVPMEAKPRPSVLEPAQQKIKHKVHRRRKAKKTHSEAKPSTSSSTTVRHHGKSTEYFEKFLKKINDFFNFSIFLLHGTTL